LVDKDKKSKADGDIPNPMFSPRYTQIATFMRAPLVTEYSGLDIALVGVPFDGGVSNRTGARQGPGQIREMSRLIRPVHHVTRINPYELCKIADVGDVPLTRPHSQEDAREDIESFFRNLHDEGVTPLAAGGDHSITYPIFKGLATGQPIGLIHIDAHTDTWDELFGSKLSHGAPFRRAVEDGLLDPRRTVQIGIRGAQVPMEGWDYSREKGMRVIFIEELDELGMQGVVAEARRVVGDGPTYISFDVDALDPAFAPGTGTPEVGGLTTREAQALIRGLRGLNLIGGDVVEVAPPYDPAGHTALVAATMMFEILCLLAEVLQKPVE
jgi:guanidinopropionase